MPGTFYIAPTPDDPPFVSKGDKVKKGQTLCIIEAMKIMNEIESEYDGHIIDVLVKILSQLNIIKLYLLSNPHSKCLKKF